MKIAFLSELRFKGKVPENYDDMRTEFAWMAALRADHYNIYFNVSEVVGYDKVLIIFPKGEVYLNAVGARLSNQKNSVSDLLQRDLVGELRAQGNKEIYYVQEGPHWLWNDYEIVDQVGFYNFVSSCDGIYAHNEYDTKYYTGMFPMLDIRVIPSLMIDALVQDIVPVPEDKVIIGGNFARWYGGFESYIVASEFNLPIWAQDSHAKREHEPQIENLRHLDRLSWTDWMKALSTFKYAVHLMPTVAAGTFSLNCAYLGIPVIGNIAVDTQRTCHPMLSIEVHDVFLARQLARQLRDDIDFYKECSTVAKENYTRRVFNI